MKIDEICAIWESRLWDFSFGCAKSTFPLRPVLIAVDDTESWKGRKACRRFFISFIPIRSIPTGYSFFTLAFLHRVPLSFTFDSLFSLLCSADRKRGLQPLDIRPILRFVSLVLDWLSSLSLSLSLSVSTLLRRTSWIVRKSNIRFWQESLIFLCHQKASVLHDKCMTLKFISLI